MTGSSGPDRLVLITGASSGIGREAARRFAASGWRVVGVARDAARLDDLSREVGGPGRLLPVAADVTDAASMERMAARVLAERGVPDVVVANAGIGLDARFTETTDELLRAVFEVNVFGLVRTVRPFVEPMARRGSGRIVLISSIVGKRGVPHYTAYSGSKFAVQGIADVLCAELSDTGVTVGVVCPASTETEFQQRIRRRGPPQSQKRPRRHSAESVATAIYAMATSRKRERVLGLEGRLMVLANAIAPGLLDRFLARMLMR